MIPTNIYVYPTENDGAELIILSQPVRRELFTALVLRVANNPALEVLITSQWRDHDRADIIFRHRPECLEDYVGIELKFRQSETGWGVEFRAVFESSWFSHETDSCHSSESARIISTLSLSAEETRKLITESLGKGTYPTLEARKKGIKLLCGS